MTDPTCPTCNVPWTDHGGIAATCAEVQQLTHERDMYRKLFESALSHVDRVFQLCAENPEPILPDFAKIGEDKFSAVVRLAEDYKRLRASLAAISEKLEQIKKRHGHWPKLNGALMELYQLTQEQP